MITPVLVLSVRPAGREGDTENDDAAPPVTVGELVSMASPLKHVTGFTEYEFKIGRESSYTVMVMSIDDVPEMVSVPAFEAVTVKVVAAMVCVGVPEISPVVP